MQLDFFGDEGEYLFELRTIAERFVHGAQPIEG